jgi:hypothetical protein
MKRMRAAGRAELLDSELVGLLLFVFGGGVVATFASVARHSDEISHDYILSPILPNCRIRSFLPGRDRSHTTRNDAEIANILPSHHRCGRFANHPTKKTPRGDCVAALRAPFGFLFVEPTTGFEPVTL